ncbi:uncharacterized protein LOC114449880 isoform X2 [Parambassis ranga]|nr:uncharacterized protein LOC114449880 isoform X2 [Parambassis ranga]
MYPKHSSRLQKASKKSPQSSPTQNEEVIQRRLRSRRRRTDLKKAEPGETTVADEGKVRDILDVINSSHDVECVSEDEEKITEITDKRLDDSDEECHSVCDSTASGPSLAYRQTLKKPSQNLCSSCRKLYQRAKRIKKPIKSKLLDNDPMSMTCDQWVLIKKWAPSRVPITRRRPLSHIQLLKKISVKQREQYASEEGLSTCSRPHTFLQRNLRCCLKLQEKKEKKKSNRRKRRRDDSQDPRDRKQQRRHSNNGTQHIRISCLDDDLNSSGPNTEDCINQETDDPMDTDLTIELIPTRVTMTTAKPAELQSKQKTPRKTRGFKDLLSQLRGNTSVIIRENR